MEMEEPGVSTPADAEMKAAFGLVYEGIRKLVVGVTSLKP